MPEAIALVAPYLSTASIGPRSVRSRRIVAGFGAAGIGTRSLVVGRGSFDPRADVIASGPGPLVGDMGDPGMSLRRRARAGTVQRARRLVPVPDAHAGWALRLSQSPDLAVRPTGVRAVYAVGPPFSSLILGAVLARRWQVPLIGDLGDPWPARSWAEMRIRRWTLARTDALVMTTESAAALYRRHCTVLVAPNGADSLLAEDPETSPPLFLHMGTLSHLRSDHTAAFAALTELDSAGLIRFRSYGETWVRLAPEAARCHRGVVSEEEARSLMVGAAAQLVVGNRTALQIPSKVYEIARSNVWGLYVSELEGDPGAALLDNSEHGVRADNSKSAVRAAALEILARLRAGQRPSPTENHSWEQTIDRVVGLTKQVMQREAELAHLVYA